MFYITHLIKRFNSFKKNELFNYSINFQLTNQPYTVDEQSRNKRGIEDTTHGELSYHS